MKKTTFYFISILIPFLIACDKEVEQEQEEVISKVKIEVVYEQEDFDYKPDQGAKIFVYYGIETIAIHGYNYEGDGVLTKKGSPTIKADQGYIADQYGIAFIQPRLLKEPITWIVESNHKKGDFMISSCLSSVNLSISSIFN